MHGVVKIRIIRIRGCGRKILNLADASRDIRRGTNTRLILRGNQPWISLSNCNGTCISPFLGEYEDNDVCGDWSGLGAFPSKTSIHKKRKNSFTIQKSDFSIPRAARRLQKVIQPTKETLTYMCRSSPIVNAGSKNLKPLTRPSYDG
jgi:hypothetical protein